jgi:hypothetical protein
MTATIIWREYRHSWKRENLYSAENEIAKCLGKDKGILILCIELKLQINKERGVNMEFKESIKSLAERSLRVKPQLKTEEHVKHYLIMPFVQSMGYDIFDPSDIVPEYVLEPGNEKTDYALLGEGEPRIFIEVRKPDDDIKEHKDNLCKIFNASGKAKIAILTCGINYHFFSDINETGKMDEEAFFNVNLEDLNDITIEELSKFQKKDFNIEQILSTPVNMKYFRKAKEYLKGQVTNPDDDFTGFVLSHVYSGEITDEVKERFTKIIKDAIMNIKEEKPDGEVKKEEETSQPTEEKSEEKHKEETHGKKETEEEKKAKKKGLFW